MNSILFMASRQKKTAIKKISQHVLVLFLVLFVKNTLASHTEVLSDPNVRKFIKERGTIQNSIRNLVVRNRIYIKDAKIEEPTRFSGLHLTLTLSTCKMPKTQPENEWEGEIDSFYSKLQNYPNASVRVNMEHQILDLSDQPEETSKEIAHITAKETSHNIAKEIDFVAFLRYLIEKCAAKEKTKSFELSLPYESFFFCNIHNTIALLRSQIRNLNLYLWFRSSCTLLYNHQEKKIYEITNRTKISAYSHTIHIREKEYLIVQREEDSDCRFDFTKNEPGHHYHNEYNLHNIAAAYSIANPDTRLEKVSLTYIPEEYIASTLHNQNKLTVVFKDDFCNRSNPIVRVLSTPCIFYHDGRGNFFIDQFFFYSGPVDNIVFSFTLSREQEKLFYQEKLTSSLRDISFFSFQKSPFIPEEPKEKQEENNTLIPHFATIKVVEIYNFPELKEITILEPYFSKIEKIRFMCDITPLCTREAGFSGSLLSFIKKYLTFQDSLEFKLYTRNYLKNVIENTIFTHSTPSTTRKRQIVLDNLNQWSYKIERENNTNSLLFNITKKDLEIAENKQTSFLEDIKQVPFLHDIKQAPLFQDGKNKRIFIKQ